jgi:hypothetical protein
MSSAPPAVIDKEDLWFLESVAEFGTPLYMLLLPDVAMALNMSCAHGLSPEALCEKLVLLCERDLIQIRQSADGGQVARTREEITRVLAGSRPRDPEGFGFQLTARGGRTWEHYARPDWSGYVDSYTRVDPQEGIIHASSREAAEAEFQRCMDDGSTEQPIAESKQGEVLVPWRATYWKELPSGYRLRYEWVKRSADVRRMMSAPVRPPWFSALVLDE